MLLGAVTRRAAIMECTALWRQVDSRRGSQAGRRGFESQHPLFDSRDLYCLNWPADRARQFWSLFGEARRSSGEDRDVADEQATDMLKKLHAR